MAAQLSWVTVPGTIANFPIGMESTVQLIVADTKNTGATFTFSKIYGDLPTGLTLSSNGIISGTPEYSSASNNYFTSIDYIFVARVISSDGRVLDGRFNIIITNTVNRDFEWITPAGNLGTVPNGSFYSLLIQAESSAPNGITYSCISGELPTGMQLISHQVNKTVVVGQFPNNNILKLSTVYTISVGDYVYGAKIPAGTIVSSIDNNTNTVIISNNTTSIVNAGEIIKFYSRGMLQGVPTVLTPITVNESKTYRFTIRATNGLGHISDRAFSLSVTNIYAPIIEPEVNYLGAFFDGTYYSQQLEILQLNPNVQIDWSITSGRMPPGLSLSDTGEMYGYLEPVDLIGPYGPAGYDGVLNIGEIKTASEFTVGKEFTIVSMASGAGTPTDFTQCGASSNTIGLSFIATGPGFGTGTAMFNGVAVDEQLYDAGPYQFNQLSQTQSYTFTVQAFDGANPDLQTYTMKIVSRRGYNADSSMTINDTYLTADSGNVYIPVLRNISSILPIGRQDSYYAFKLDGFDFDLGTGPGLTYSLVDTLGTYDGSPYDPLEETGPGDGIGNNGLPGSFDLVSTTTSNLPGVELSADTGWIYGHLNPQASALEEYVFGVKVCKTEITGTYCSLPRYFTLPILGNPNSVISWITPADLGSVNNGSVSEMYLEAVSAAGADVGIIYELVDRIGISCRLPQGLTLLSTGEICGRATFESFSLDDYNTTIDSGDLTIDLVHTFRVSATAEDQSSSTEKTFTIKLNIIDQEPLEDLYLKAMPSMAQRQLYNSLIINENIFNSDFIYRPNDPYYGVQEDLKMLFLPGLTASELEQYQTAVTHNHYTKIYTFGEVKTAFVLDELYNVKYEVVYVEVVDPEENISGVGPGLELDLTNTISNPYIDSTGNEYKIVYPNSSDDMIVRLETIIGYQDQSSLPNWMTSNQPDRGSSTGFTIPLGYTKAVVIAYAKKDCGEKIAYRIKQSGINFNRIEFSTDRYQLDNYYSNNYNKTTLAYVNDRETTFDLDPNLNIGTIVATVTYGVQKPFSQINGRSISYINANGGIDGTTSFADGETLIFVKQEQFVSGGPYDGWVDYSGAYIGDNTETTLEEGYDFGSYDTYTAIPGYLEKTMGTGLVNRRGGVWRIHIINDIVNLEFILELEINERVRILFGKTLSSAIMMYSTELEVGQTVPFYKVFVLTPTIRVRTTFNNDSTKFFTYRDHYYEPGSQDKYVKFPQYGVFT